MTKLDQLQKALKELNLEYLITQKDDMVVCLSVLIGDKK